MAGFDPITFAMLQNMKKSGGIGYSEPTIFRLDKSTETLEYNTPVKVSDKTPDLDTIVSIKGFIEGADTEVSATECRVVHDSEELSYLAIDAGGSPVPVLYVAKADSIDSTFPERGIYFAYYTPDNYMYYAEFAETIHPIDPKFLPGVCLPVKIDLADYGVDISSIVMTGGRVGFNIGEDFWKAIDTDARVFVKILSGFQRMDIWGEITTRLYGTTGVLMQVSTRCPVSTGTNIVDATVFFSFENDSAGERTTYVTVVTSVSAMPGQ